jgi:hypothetical protein
MMKQSASFVICIKNSGHEASLEPRKIYRVLSDTRATQHQLLRVIDESGEDYLYPADYFAPVELPQVAVKAFAMAGVG